MDEDPWDNYLIHDSKYFLPLVCHKQPLGQAELLLLTQFLTYSLEKEIISEFKATGDKLIQELIEYFSERKVEEDGLSDEEVDEE